MDILPLERARDYPDSIFHHVIPNESELTGAVRIEPGKQYGFFTDTTVCIGCKSCEVACKEWNNLPADDVGLTGHSYDNTGALSANTWRHVNFIEKKQTDPGDSNERPLRGVRDNDQNPFQSGWLMMSDVCKHCHHAPCMEACPTGALFKTEFDTVVVQQDICNGCGYCVSACPFGVVDLNPIDGKAHKCTLCYDRLKGGLEPACAKACPTESIQFGELSDLHQRAAARVEHLHERGVTSAYTYGTPGGPGATGDMKYLNSFFLLTDRPEAYNLPVAPTRPSRRVKPAFKAGLGAMAGLAVVALMVFARAKINEDSHA